MKGLEQDRNLSYHVVWHIGCMASFVDETTRSVETVDVVDCMDEWSGAVVETKLCFIVHYRPHADNQEDETNCVASRSW